MVAWSIDWLAILVWVGVVAAVGVPLYLAGVIRMTHPLLLNAVGAVLIVIPVTFALAAFEAGAKHGTLGKRAMRLRVEPAEPVEAPEQLDFGRALLRNALKIAVPWLIGHAAVYELTRTAGEGMLGMVLLVAAYVLPAAYLVTLFTGSHRTLYDRLAGTIVIAKS